MGAGASTGQFSAEDILSESEIDPNEPVENEGYDSDLAADHERAPVSQAVQFANALSQPLQPAPIVAHAAAPRETAPVAPAVPSASGALRLLP